MYSLPGTASRRLREVAFALAVRFDNRKPVPHSIPTAMIQRIDKSNERIRKMFAGIAPRYDFLNHLLSLNVDRYWRWRTVANAPPQGTGPILDVCTGTGDLALAYREYDETAREVVGTDFCGEMLELAEEKKEAAGIEARLAFVEADTQNLPFPDNRFQIVSVAFGLRNVADTDRGLAEMTRVCQPGGRVVVLEFSMPEWEPAGFLYRWYFSSILPRIGQWFSASPEDAYEYLPESVGEFPYGAALVRRMEAAGLVDVAHHPLTFGIATLYIGRKPGEAIDA